MRTVAHTFDVSQVKPASEPLPEVPYHVAVNTLVNRQRPPEIKGLRSKIEAIQNSSESGRGEQARLLRLQKQGLAFAQAADQKVEACSCNHGRLVAGVEFHAVIEAIHLAFCDHRPLSLSPDMIWLLIAQGAARHINLHAEELRPQFVRHAGKETISVRRDDFIKGSPKNPWGEVVDELSAKVREHLGEFRDLLTPQFSTTGPVERVASEIAMLDAMQSYFQYEAVTICGIPKITLEGTVDDWRELARRAAAFAQFDLEWWLTPLQPILQEFVAAAQGEVHCSFWRSIYKRHEVSGGPKVTGWITAFFPYFQMPRRQGFVKNRWLEAGGVHRDQLLYDHGDAARDVDGPLLRDFPAGISLAPFVWKYYSEDFAMELLGGFVGVSQDAATLTLRPEIGWAVRDVRG